MSHFSGDRLWVAYGNYPATWLVRVGVQSRTCQNFCS